MENQTTYLKDYRPANFKILSIHLTFDVQSVFDVVVTNRMHLQRQALGPLVLHADELVLKEIYLNETSLEQHQYELKADALIIQDCPDDFILTVVTQQQPEKNKALSGLYASRGMLCTQCEAEGFRRITYFLDRPDVMSIFTTQIIADKVQFPFLLSNGNLQETGDIDESRHYAIWHDPFLKPSYLFAMVAGQFVRVSDEFLTQSGKTVGLDIFVEPGDEHYCSFAMQAIKDAMKWDEHRFGREYDLERYMIVAVKDFNMGAMENKGLNIFNVKYVLADEKTATDEDILGIESVIAHEYFHNWTGNRVTCRDWFQLSLKEGLTVYRDQEFSRDMNDRVTLRIADVAQLRKVQFLEDAGTMAHPVQPKSYQEISNFYTATVYEKGAELVRMYQVILGPEGFRKGMDLYFQRHDGQAVRIEEFLAAMSDANHVDLRPFHQWYDQAGTPEVEVKEWVEGNRLHIQMSQSCSNTADGSEKKPLMIPIKWAVYQTNGQRVEGIPSVLILTEKNQEFIFDIKHADVLVNYLHDFSAPIILKRDLSLAQILALMAVEQDGFALWDLKQKLMIEWIQRAYHQEKMQALPPKVLDIFQSWVDKQTFSLAFLAELFRVPSFQECCIGLKAFDPILLFQMHQSFEKAFAVHFQEMFFNILEKYQHQESREIRVLRNICLNFLMQADAKLYAQTCETYFTQAQNMTNRMAAFKAIMQTENELLKTRICEKFYHDWSENELVLDKWFFVQATQMGADVLEKVKRLSQHPKFNWTNPNKLYMLMGGFSQNVLAFHDITGQGYAFLKDCILKVDSFNPQIASRLAQPLTRWQSYDTLRQAKIQEVLQEMMRHDLSKDLEEIVRKSMPLAY
jgi:aminopeptidase N